MPNRGRRGTSSASDVSAPTPSAGAPATGNPVMDMQGGAGNAAAQQYLSDLDHGVGEDGAYGAADEENWLGGIFQDLDRMMARVELAGRFDIVGDDFTGERAPNQVSQEEFDRLTTLYSDIRRGDTNIQFADTGDAEADGAFRNAAMGDVADLLTTREGRNLLDDVAYNSFEGTSHTVTLGNQSNSGAAGMDMAPGQNAANIFDGQGVDTVLNYAAGVDFDLATGDSRFRNASFRNTSSDMVLFHELVHAQHYQQGNVNGSMESTGPFFYDVSQSDAVVQNDVGINEEEYMTVGLLPGSDYTENEYRRQRAAVTGENIPQRTSYFGPNASGR